MIVVFSLVKSIKDTLSENTSSNKTQALPKGMNVDIWVTGTLNQLFTRGSYTQMKY